MPNKTEPFSVYGHNAKSRYNRHYHTTLCFLEQPMFLWRRWESEDRSELSYLLSLIS